MTPDQITYYQDIAQRLKRAPYGTKSKLIEDACIFTGLNKDALYRNLEAVGYHSGRKIRADKGTTSIDLEDAKLICQFMDSSQRENSKRLLSCEDAIEVLYANGQIKERYVPSTIFRIAQAHGFHPEQLARPAPHQNLRSLHPNHVWQVDASVCILFYLPSGGVKTMDPDEFYKNKPQNLLKVRNELCIRYVITDHYSATIFVKYYVGSGETQEFLFDLLASAFEVKKLHIMHGVPLLIVFDKGAANTAHMVQSFLDKMRVNHYAHKTGNSRAKGSVETSQNIVECQFEALTAYKKYAIRDVHELNHHAERWQYYFNAQKILSRAHCPRFELWQRITQEQLRLAPPRAVMQTLLTSKPQERTVQGDLSISFKIKGYDEPFNYSVKHIKSLNVRDKVLVTVNPYRTPNVDVITYDLGGKEVYHECTPRTQDSAGFYLDAAVIGEEMKRLGDTRTDHMQKESLQAQYPGAKTQEDAKKMRKKRVAKFGGDIDPFKHINDSLAESGNVTFIPKKGTVIDIEAPKQVFEPITVFEACKRIQATLGADYETNTYQRLSKKYPNGIDPLELDHIIQQLKHPQPQLKVIGE